jgi:hypothetical protein
MVSGQTRRMCGSSAIYSSHANAGTKNTSPGPLVSTDRSPVASALLTAPAARMHMLNRKAPRRSPRPRRRLRSASSTAMVLARGATAVRMYRPTRSPDVLPCQRLRLSRVHGATISKYAGLPHGRSLDSNGHIRAVRICAFPGGPRVRKDWRDPSGLDGRKLCDGQASLRKQRCPISRRCRSGRGRGFRRPLDLHGDGQQADQPTSLIESQRRHPGTRGGRIQRRHDIGAADWHQTPGTVPVPEEQRRRFRCRERVPSRGRSVVLVDVSQVVDIGRVSNRFVSWRVLIAQVPQHRMGSLGERL